METIMGWFTPIAALTLLLAACTKEEVTKIVPASPNTTQSDERNQAEGTINGGGGKGVLCRKNGVTTVETLDLYEAKVLYDLEIVKSGDTQEQALDLFTTLLTKHLWNPDTVPMDEYKKNFHEMVTKTWLKNIRFIDSDRKLKLVHDSFEPLVEAGCELVQVAVYYDESILLVDKSLWDKMNWLNKIGLLAHELIYYRDRQNGSTNSMATRKLVGQLFSTKGARPRADGVPKERSQYARCYVSDKGMDIGYFYAYPSQKMENGASGLELVFNYLRNETNLFRTSGFLPKANFESLKEKPYRGETQTDLIVDGYPVKRGLKFDFEGDARGKLSIIDKSWAKPPEIFDLYCELPMTTAN